MGWCEVPGARGKSSFFFHGPARARLPRRSVSRCRGYDTPFYRLCALKLRSCRIKKGDPMDRLLYLLALREVYLLPFFFAFLATFFFTLFFAAFTTTLFATFFFTTFFFAEGFFAAFLTTFFTAFFAPGFAPLLAAAIFAAIKFSAEPALNHSI